MLSIVAALVGVKLLVRGATLLVLRCSRDGGISLGLASDCDFSIA
jgi:hypothetical protein